MLVQPLSLTTSTLNAPVNTGDCVRQRLYPSGFHRAMILPMQIMGGTTSGSDTNASRAQPSAFRTLICFTSYLYYTLGPIKTSRGKIYVRSMPSNAHSTYYM